ncbi:MAG: GAF domain-containing protein [Acidobacteria bacterium]|nr:GAF domain-containing protein [Acidobacteriota bacterium]
MSLGLETLTSCFQGLIPATLYTCAADGTPNSAYLSHVEYVDATHVALSFQFFNKSRRNVEENPQALVRVVDPDTQQGWELRLRLERSETSGPLFDRMALRIEAIASYCGMKGIFRLLAADVYEVLSVGKVPEQPGAPPPVSDRRALDAVFTMRALQHLTERINAADGLEPLIDAILAGLDEVFGFSHSMILLPGEQPRTLITIATRGYPENGAGAEARFGEGITGLVAEARKPIRISGLMRGMLYAYAARFRAEEAGWCPAERRIPLPGLANPASQLGVPLLVRGELVGVLVIESETPYRFHEDDKQTIELLGAYLALAIQNAVLQEAGEAADPRASAPTPGPAALAVPTATLALAYYRADDVVMVDGEYLIRGLPARILWKLVTIHAADGRAEFTNRELRLDKTLQLPEYKDNLETRLLLLRRRLEQKCPALQIVPRGRGRFALVANAAVSLVERP